jgi:uncharacterized protein YmfQ (DUF2313 family)
MAKRWGASRWGTRTWGGYRIYKPNLTDFAISPDAPEATITRIKTIPPPGRLMSDVAVTMTDSMSRHVVFAPVREAPVPATLARSFIPLTYRMLDDMPPYEADEPMIQLYVDTVARELQRIYDAGQVLRHQFWPQNADEDYQALAMWEGILGLPIEPNGVRPPARRAIVMAKLRARHVSSGLRWVELLTAALGSEVWTYQEGPEDYTIRISIPFKEGSWRAGQVAQAARDITPAHLVIDVDYTDGFILNESLLSTDRL